MSSLIWSTKQCLLPAELTDSQLTSAYTVDLHDPEPHHTHFNLRFIDNHTVLQDGPGNARDFQTVSWAMIIFEWQEPSECDNSCQVQVRGNIAEVAWELHL